MKDTLENKKYYHTANFLHDSAAVSTYLDANLPKMLVVALALRTRAHKSIDEVYSKKNNIYYDLYKNNENFIKQDKNLFIYPVEIDKKIRQLIGIVTHAIRDEEDVEDFDMIMNKGFHDIKRFMKRNDNNVSFDEYYKSKNKKVIADVDMQQVFCELVAFVYFGKAYNKKFSTGTKMVELIVKIMEPLNDYDALLPNLYLGENQDYLRSFCEVFDLLMPKKNQEYSIIGYLSLNGENNLVQTEHFTEIAMRLGAVSDFYDTVYIDSAVLTSKTKLTGEEIQVCMLSTISSIQESKDAHGVTMDMLLLFINHLNIVAMSKYYKDAKTKANIDAEEEYLHLSYSLRKEFNKKEKRLEKEQAVMLEKNNRFAEENNKLQEQVKELTRKLKQKEEKEKKIISYESEVIGLRNFLYRSQTGAIPITRNTPEENQEILRQYSFVIFGGHPIFTNKLKSALPDTRFVSSDEGNISFSFIKNIDVVFVFSEYFNHGMYYKLMKSLSDSTKIIYLPKTVNVNQTLDFMVNELS